MPRKKKNLVLIFLLSVGILAAGAASVFFWLRHDGLLTKQARVVETILTLEHVTGYAGFIHNFKNAVLRPQEPVYLATALDQYAQALDALDILEQLAASESVPIDLTLYRSALHTYRDDIEKLRIRTYDSTGIGQADALVRVPDGAARANPDSVTTRLTTTLDTRVAPIRRALAAALAATASLITLLLGEIIHTARIRGQHAEMLGKQLLSEQQHRTELAAALAQLHQTNREQAEFTYAISHDLKAPTNTASMLVRALQEDLSGTIPDDASELLDDLDGVLKRMARLIDDTLGYAGAFDTERPRALVALDAVLDDVISDLRADIQHAHAQIRRQPLPRLRANPVQMRNLLLNLVQNALKFGHPDQAPLIDISPSQAPDGSIAFLVRDNGIGIPSHQITRAFSLFGRLHDRGEYEGTGLGLPICQRIAQTHGGDITIASTEGCGTTFTVTMKAA